MQRRRIALKSGLTLSIQANEMSYCTPRNDTGPWSHVEVGFPSEEVPELMEYMDALYPEEEEDPTGQVYGWVPIKTIIEIIDKHGGVKGALNRNGDCVPLKSFEFEVCRKSAVLMESLWDRKTLDNVDAVTEWRGHL
jgi:hypothetical protein